MAGIDDLNALKSAGVKKTAEAGRTIEFFSPGEENELVDSTKKEEAAKKPHFGLRMTKLVPPGAG